MSDINHIPADYAGGLREKIFDRAGPKAWADYQQVFANDLSRGTAHL